MTLCPTKVAFSSQRVSPAFLVVFNARKIEAERRDVKAKSLFTSVGSSLKLLPLFLQNVKVVCPKSSDLVQIV